MANDFNDGTFNYTFSKSYLIPFILSCIASVILAHFNISSSDLTSAQYLISALVQGEAAILAIIISVTIFAVSNSQSYSPRIIDIFLDKDRTPHFWSLLALYVFALIYGAFILKILHAEDSYEPSNIQASIWIAYFLAAQAFISLIGYMKYALITLKPSNIIENLADEMEINDILRQKTESSLIDSIAPHYSLPQNSIVRPILDIINASIVNNSNEIAIKGIDAIEKKVILIVKEQNLEVEQYAELLQSFYEKCFNIGNFCIEQNNYEVLVQVTESMTSLEVIMIEVQHKTESIGQMISLLDNLAMASIEKNNEIAFSQILKSMISVGTKVYSLDANTNILINLIDTFKTTCIHLGNVHKYVLNVKTVVSLGIFGREILMMEYNKEFADKLRVALENIGMYALRTKDGNTCCHSVKWMLEIIQILSIEQKDVSDYNDSLDKIIKMAIDNRFYPHVVEICNMLQNYPAATVSLKAELREDGRSYLINDAIHS